MIEIKYTGDALWKRIERAVEKVKDRLRRVTRALNSANIPYAVIGGNAVQHWVAQVDESVVRNTRDVDIILNESDLDAAIEALAAEGFIYRRSAGVTMFLDGPEAKARDAVQVVFAGKKVRKEYPEPVPEIEEYEIIVERKGAMDEITLRVEPQEEMGDNALAKLSVRLSERLKIKTNLRFKIKFTLPGDLPRYTLKSKRFKDLRGA